MLGFLAGLALLVIYGIIAYEIYKRASDGPGTGLLR